MQISSAHYEDVCSAVFHDFAFSPLAEAQPPRERGVYVIRVAKPGFAVEQIVPEGMAVVHRLNWPMVANKMVNRLQRLERIGTCPIIYVGSAGTRHDSKNTLRGRYEEFSGRHTIMYPLWALLYFGWELEYGWRAEQEADRAERELKQAYRDLHDSKLPALVYR